MYSIQITIVFTQIIHIYFQKSPSFNHDINVVSGESNLIQLFIVWNLNNMLIGFVLIILSWLLIRESAKFRRWYYDTILSTIVAYRIDLEKTIKPVIASAKRGKGKASPRWRIIVFDYDRIFEPARRACGCGVAGGHWACRSVEGLRGRNSAFEPREAGLAIWGSQALPWACRRVNGLFESLLAESFGQ